MSRILPLLKILLPLSVFFAVTGCVPAHQIVHKGELESLEKQVQAQNHYLAALIWERNHSNLILQKSREEIGALRMELQELANRQPVAPVSPPPPPHPRPQVRAPKPPPPAPAEKPPGATKVVGASEKVFLTPPDIHLPARIDTGAATSSVDARDIRHFERDGKKWVRFHVVDPESGEKVELERQIVRHVRILQSATEEAERRPVIELQFVLGGVSQTAQFTLSDRAHLEFPLLIGRNILQDVMLVDVGKTYTTTPQVPPRSQ